MLLIKTKLGLSKFHGIGIFADEFIPQNKIIWEYFPDIDITFSKQQWLTLKNNLAAPSFKMVQRYSYKEDDQFIICLDNAQFMNHSDTPNITNTEDLKSMFANRDIEVGEELLCDYLEYCDGDDDNLKGLHNV